MSKNEGISFITVIITIIVIIILAAISLYNSSRTPELAGFTMFSHEMNEIQTQLGVVRANNFEETRDFDSGFTMVTVENAPDDFISFPNDENEIKGYLVNTELLGDTPSFGTAPVLGDTVSFDVDDAFVYDKNGTLYYLKGYEDNENVYYNPTVKKK